MSRAGIPIVATLATLAWANTASARPHHHRHRPCASSERVLGRRTCGVFGDGTYATRLPPITLAWSAQARTLGVPEPAASPGTVAREQQPSSSGGLDTLGSGVRLLVGIAPPLYAGFEGSVGFGVESAAGGYGAFAAIVGARQRRERTTLGFEVAPGVVAVGTGRIEPRLDLDVRVRADYWATPWVTLGAFAGIDPFVRDRTFGAQVALHLRAFDGDR